MATAITAANDRSRVAGGAGASGTHTFNTSKSFAMGKGDTHAT